jgi:hypothetical protein
MTTSVEICSVAPICFNLLSFVSLRSIDLCSVVKEMRPTAADGQTTQPAYLTSFPSFVQEGRGGIQQYQHCIGKETLRRIRPVKLRYMS